MCLKIHWTEYALEDKMMLLILSLCCELSDDVCLYDMDFMEGIRPYKERKIKIITQVLFIRLVFLVAKDGYGCDVWWRLKTSKRVY